MRLVAAFIDPTAGSEATLQRFQDAEQMTPEARSYGFRQAHGMLAHRPGRLEQASIGITPSPGHQNPVQNQQAQQLGIEFTQDAPGFLRAPLIGLDLRFGQSNVPPPH